MVFNNAFTNKIIKKIMKFMKTVSLTVTMFIKIIPTEWPSSNFTKIVR